jgi:integrase
MEHVLSALMPANALAIEVSMRYGLRIGDVLSLTPSDVEKGRFTVHEAKTGKSKRIRLSADVQKRLLASANAFWCFPHRLDPKKHRTRQAVYKDVVRAVRAFRLHEHVTPHSARKAYAVALYERYGDMERVQRALNHSSPEVTMIYALANALPTSSRKGA